MLYSVVFSLLTTLCKSFHCKTMSSSIVSCSACHLGVGGVDQQKHKRSWRNSSVASVSLWFSACMGVNGGLCMKQSSQTRWPQRTRLHLEDMEISVVIHDGHFYFMYHLFFFHFQFNYAALKAPPSIYTFISTISKWDFIHTQKLITYLKCKYSFHQEANYLRPLCTGSLFNSYCKGADLTFSDVIQFERKKATQTK